MPPYSRQPFQHPFNAIQLQIVPDGKIGDQAIQILQYLTVLATKLVNTMFNTKTIR